MTLLDKNPEVLIQGITGREGSFHSRLMKAYGTKIVAGVTPGKGGALVDGIPVFNTVREVTARFPGADTSVVFVPAAHSKAAVLEALENEVKHIIVITEGIPQHDALQMVHYARRKSALIIGPNCPGIISPPYTKLGIMPAEAFIQGDVGLVSRSGTLTYEVGEALRRAGIGVSMAIGIGGDPIVGTSLSEVTEILDGDPRTAFIVVLGEIGGSMEEKLAENIRSGAIEKPVISYIAGQTAPPGKRMGHAGAILDAGVGTAGEKISALRNAGVSLARDPWEIPRILQKIGCK